MGDAVRALLSGLDPTGPKTTSFRAKRQRLTACRQATAEAAADWVERATWEKGLPAGHPEEWMTGPYPVLRQLRQLEMALRRAEAPPAAADPGRVVPADRFDRILFRGFEARQILGGEPTPANPDADVEEPRVLVLGAGNVSAIPAMDALTKIFNENKPCLVKLSPVNDWVERHLCRALAPLIDCGWLAFVRGDHEEGGELCEDPNVTEVHLTGSGHTHDVLVWGDTEAERNDRKARGAPRLRKPITSELGNVSPAAVVPAVYAESEIESVAQTLAASVVHNGSFNCNATRVVLVAEGWHQKYALRRRLEQTLASVPLRKAYYPGATERYDHHLHGRPEVWTSAPRGEDRLPWTLVNAEASDEDSLFSEECFCPIIAWVELDVAGTLDFLEVATRFMNERLAGTLNATLFLPDVMRSSEVQEPLQAAVDALRYGTVGINQWPALGFAWGGPVWGGHPGATLEDPQSGIGWVHNAWMLQGVQKSVLSGPLVPFPKPVWFPDHRTAADVGRRLVAFERTPGWWSLASVAMPALLG